MAAEELLLYFVVIPAIAYGAVAVLLRSSMRKIASTELGFLREPGVNARFLVYVAVFFEPVVFGLVLSLQFRALPDFPTYHDASRALGLAYASAAVIVETSEAALIVRWKASAYRGEFRELSVLIAEMAVALLLVWLFVFVGAQKLQGPLSTPTVNYAEVGLIILASSATVVGSASAPIIALIAARPPAGGSSRFRGTVARATASLVLPVGGFVIAFFLLANVD